MLLFARSFLSTYLLLQWRTHQGGQAQPKEQQPEHININHVSSLPVRLLTPQEQQYNVCPVWSAAQSTSQEGMSNLCLCKPGGKVEIFFFLFFFLVLQMRVHSFHWLSWFPMLGLICFICDSIKWVSMWHILWWQRISHVSRMLYLVTNQHPPLGPFHILSLGLPQLPSAVLVLIMIHYRVLLPAAAIRGQTRSCGGTRTNGEGWRGGREKLTQFFPGETQNNIPHVHDSHKTLSNAKLLI